MKRSLLVLALLFPLFTRAAAVDPTAAVTAINALGLDLYRAQPAGGNVLLSPYSIQSALAMTYAGADGATQMEMQRVLHYPADEAVLDAGFAELARELEQMDELAEITEMVRKNKTVKLPPSIGTWTDFHLANRLFVQSGFELRPPFLARVKDSHGAVPESLDFAHAPEAARLAINQWAADTTNGKIHDLVPPDGVTKVTKLVLANAVYLRAMWLDQFKVSATKPEPFWIRGSQQVLVPTMMQDQFCYYRHYEGFIELALPYVTSSLRFLILLPDKPNGLPALEAKITPEILAECANLHNREVILHLPKFRLEPSSMPLGAQLYQLGLRTVLDVPRGSADFGRMAPRKPNDYLFISDVFYKAFLSIDEQGTEAAAATVTSLSLGFGCMLAHPPKPIEVRVDHPFLFAIQDVKSGACLFLGRVTDPR